MAKQRFFHGDITPTDIAQSLSSEFEASHYIVRKKVAKDQIIIQISTRNRPISGGKTGITVFVQKVPDGIAVHLGNQSQFGILASIGQTTFMLLKNPWNIINRIDDISQDIQNIQLSDRIWSIVEETAKNKRASFEFSENLRRVICEYCLTPNPITATQCIACGAPLSGSRPITCPECGFVLEQSTSVCPNCGANISLHDN